MRKLTESEFRLLHGIYTSTKHPAAFGSVKSLKKASGLSLAKVKAFLHTSSTYTKFKPVRRKFRRLSVRSLGINHIWSIDVAFMEKLAEHNNGYKYLLVAVDTLSRKTRVEAMKSKTSEETCRAFKKMVIFEHLDFPIKVWVDLGKEFKGSFKKFCDDNEIEIYSTHSETKSSMAERYIRSMKTLIYNFFEEFRTFRYINNLKNFVTLLNKRFNRSIAMSPNDVDATHVPILLRKQQDEHRKANKKNHRRRKVPAFKVGDRVRIAFKDMAFRKGYKQQYTSEVFRVSQVSSPPHEPITYKLRDSKGEPILGRFYSEEITHYNYLSDRSRSRHQRILF